MCVGLRRSFDLVRAKWSISRAIGGLDTLAQQRSGQSVAVVAAPKLSPPSAWTAPTLASSLHLFVELL
jgi:hypothetical protein